MKRAGLVSYAIVVALIALGSIALAAPSFRVALQAETGATGSSGPGDGTGAGGGSDSVEAPAPVAPEKEGDDGGGTAPDFTGCEGMTGLDNAICRHEALLLVHPDNEGLHHSLTRLETNLERYEAKQQSKAEKGSGDHPGKGNGGDPHDASGPGDDADEGPGNGHVNANGHEEGDPDEG
jgi:hypothetical protein